MTRLGKRVAPGGLTSTVDWYDVLFWGHDLQISIELEKNVDAVYAYEDGAERTFKEAKRRGLATIYELPLGYYLGVNHELQQAQHHSVHINARLYPQWKLQRKNHELDLADLLIVPCAWARASLQSTPIAETKPTITVPYGTPADKVPRRRSRPTGPFTVLFAGQIGVRKGVPYLLEAWKKLRLADARLWLAGSLAMDGTQFAQDQNIHHLGALPHVRLLQIMQEVDLFVFPSLAEGFGLVIGEAMASSLPVLTTTSTGGPELINNATEGWCVPPRDVAALADHIKWAHDNRNMLYEMGQRARTRAENWTWSHYRQRLVTELSSHFAA